MLTYRIALQIVLNRVSDHDLPAQVTVGETLQEWTHRERYFVSKDQGCITKGKGELLGEKNGFTGMVCPCIMLCELPGC